MLPNSYYDTCITLIWKPDKDCGSQEGRERGRELGKEGKREGETEGGRDGGKEEEREEEGNYMSVDEKILHKY